MEVPESEVSIPAPMSEPPDPSRFVECMAPAVWKAAALARALEGTVPNEPKTGEASAAKQALTQADTSAQEALLEVLLANFPDVRLEAEEDTVSVARFRDRGDALVVIDPIDGTLHSYLRSEGPYAVMIGLAQRHRFEASLVGLPREGLLFAAARGGGALRARPRGPLRSASVQTSGDRVLVSHGMHAAVVRALENAGFQASPACGGAIAVAPLIPGVRAGLRYAPEAPGVSIRGRIGVLIAREAGAYVRGVGCSEFPEDLGAPAPVLAVARSEADLEILDRALGELG